jgi:nitrogen regulatory protein P-II 1
MKQVQAIIQPFMLPHVLDALHEIEGFPGVSTTEVHAAGPTALAAYERQPRVRLEMVVPDGLVEPVIAAIQQHAHTGNPGDGHLVVLPVEVMVKIRTGERSDE